MKFSFKLSLVFLFITSLAFSQRGKDGIGNITGTSIVNAYTTLSNDVAANTTNTISVANVSSFSAGDLVLIIQMSGTWARFYAGDSVPPWNDGSSAVPGDTSYGRIMAYNGAGTNEVAQINSVNSGANTITFDCQISKAFKASGKTQIVRIPRYTSLNIGATGIITCPHWDRTLGYGGVVAIEVQGNTNIAAGGRIDASGLGFRGGGLRYRPNSGQGSANGSFVWGVTTSRYAEAGYKGESIAGDTNVYVNEASKFGLGAIANGGGGGCANNAGGGGGSNAGLTNKYFGGIGNIDTTTNTNYIQAWVRENTTLTGVLPLNLWRANTNSGGGRGGYSRSNDTDNPLTTNPNQATWAGDNRRPVGGLGGRPLDYSNNQLYLGGGGGSGSGDDSYQGPGGDGGGIIYFISYGTISGSGQIVSNGANGSNSYTSGPRGSDNGASLLGRDGGGGAGGGGAIYITSTGTVSGISVSANGGNGGNAALSTFSNTNDSYGPGGGGGGGYINLPTGTSVTTSINGGNNGIVTISGPNGSLIDNNFPPNGATKGGPGTSLATTTSFSITTTNATICSGNTATLNASLSGTAPNPVTMGWYTDSIGGNPFATGTTYTTPILTNTTIYWVGTCPGTYREKITVTVNSAPAAPVSTTPINYCLNASASSLSATATGGNTIVWYDAASGGNVLTQPITPSTSSVGATSYFVAQDNGSCVGARTEVVVNVIALPNTPNVTTPVNYCQNETPVAVSANVSGVGNSLLYWGTNASGGTSSGTAPVPSTSTVGSTSYYVSESNGTCESGRVPIVVNVNAAPAAPTTTDTVSYCQNQAATSLTPSGANYNWYTTATGGVGTTTAPTPNTSAVGVTTYYVSETQNGCESLRDSVKVVVNTSYSAPAASNVNLCNGATASALTPNGSGYNWYTVASGGTASSTITPSTATTGTVSYYVSQGAGACESPRTQVDVVVLALPNTPNVTSPVDYCVNSTASPISATASGAGNTVLYWGTDASGGTSSITAPTPTTNAAGQTIYYVSENDGACESPRTTITVNVNTIPNPPTVSDTVSYCQNQVASQLTPNGVSINWYNVSIGGSVIPAPTPNTSAVGVTTYYVSETQNGCESLRDSVKVVVNTSFSAPAASGVSNCIGSTASILTPNGTGYNWYTTATGGTASPSVTPSTATTGTVSYYVSQGSGTCESPRTQVDVITLALPNPPNVISPVNYCQNQSASAISATANGAGNTLLYWGTDATGGTSSTTATVPSTSSTGSTTYYVSENDGTCESTRSPIIVNVNAIPAAPATTDTVSYCLNETAVPLTPSGTNYNWYTTATGGSPSTAPTPSTSSNGVTTYYVSETQNGCESLRDSVKVVVNNLFTAPTASNISYCLGATASVLTPNGTGYNWYTTSTGGTASATITPTTSSAGIISYFVSQGSGSCESPRTQVDVTTHALPNKPTGTDVTYCINETASALTATGSGTLNWYTVSIGGISSATAPTPATNTVGNTNYYVSQTDLNTCESERDTITVSVINLQNAPTTSNISYCEDATASVLNATGTSQLNWWGTSAVGGTSSITAPTPNTANPGTTTYYVSQGTGACESPRASIVVTVNSKPSISFTQNVNTICENACITFTANSSVTCTNLVWDFGDGNTSTNTNANNCYSTAGTYNVKVICTNAQGCSDSSLVNNAVIVSPSPQAQISLSPGTTVTPGSTINFIADTGIVQPSIVWDFDDVASGLLNASTIYNPSHVYASIGTYCVNLIVGVGLCKDTATTCIEVISEPFIEIPNVFTPNGDGINDVFLVKSSGIISMEANIYDRWGVLIYTWSGTTGSWDGKNKSGNMSSNGVYYYIIKTTDFKNENKDFAGHLQLIDSK